MWESATQRALQRKAATSGTMVRDIEHPENIRGGGSTTQPPKPIAYLAHDAPDKTGEDGEPDISPTHKRRKINLPKRYLD
jgi:hypothetical protein